MKEKEEAALGRSAGSWEAVARLSSPSPAAWESGPTGFLRPLARGGREGAGRSGRCGENLGDGRALDVGGRTWAGSARRWGPQAPDRPRPPRLCGASQLDRCQLRGLPALQVSSPRSGPGGNHPLILSWQQLRHSPFSFARLDEAAFAISVYFYNDSNKEQPEAAAPAGPGEGREEGPRQRAPSNRAKVPHPRRQD